MAFGTLLKTLGRMAGAGAKSPKPTAGAAQAGASTLQPTYPLMNRAQRAGQIGTASRSADIAAGPSGLRRPTFGERIGAITYPSTAPRNPMAGIAARQADAAGVGGRYPLRNEAQKRRVMGIGSRASTTAPQARGAGSGAAWTTDEGGRWARSGAGGPVPPGAKPPQPKPRFSVSGAGLKEAGVKTVRGGLFGLSPGDYKRGPLKGQPRAPGIPLLLGVAGGGYAASQDPVGGLSRIGSAGEGFARWADPTGYPGEIVSGIGGLLGKDVPGWVDDDVGIAKGIIAANERWGSGPTGYRMREDLAESQAEAQDRRTTGAVQEDLARDVVPAEEYTAMGVDLTDRVGFFRDPKSDTEWSFTNGKGLVKRNVQAPHAYSRVLTDEGGRRAYGLAPGTKKWAQQAQGRAPFQMQLGEMDQSDVLTSQPELLQRALETQEPLTESYLMQQGRGAFLNPVFTSTGMRPPG